MVGTYLFSLIKVIDIEVGELVSTSFYTLATNAPLLDAPPPSPDTCEVVYDTDYDLLVTICTRRAYVQTEPVKLDGQLNLLCSWRPVPADETTMIWALFVHHDRINDLPDSVNRHIHLYNSDRTLHLSIASDDRPFSLEQA
jgi:hypothetical protein